MPSPLKSQPSSLSPIMIAILYIGVAMIHTILGLTLMENFADFSLTTFFLALMLAGSFCLVFGQRKFPLRAVLFLGLAVGIPMLVISYYHWHFASHAGRETIAHLNNSTLPVIRIYANRPPSKFALFPCSFLGVILSGAFLLLRGLGLQIEKIQQVEPPDQYLSQQAKLRQFTVLNLFELTLYFAIAIAFFLAWKNYVGWKWIHVQQMTSSSSSYSYFDRIDSESIFMIVIASCCGLIATLVKRYVIVSCLVGALCIGISVIFPNASSIFPNTSNKDVINRMAYFYSLAILVYAYARLCGYRWSWRWLWSKSIETQLDVTKE